MRGTGSVAFVVRDVCRAAPIPVTLVLPASLFAALLRLAASGLVIQFLASHAAGRGEPAVDLLGRFGGAGLDPGGTTGWVALIGAAGAGAALASYAEVTLQARIGRRYAVLAAERSLHRLADEPGEAGARFNPASLVRGVPALLGMLSPVVQSLVFGVLLFLLRPGLAAVLFGLVLVLGVPVAVLLGRRILRVGADRRTAPPASRSQARAVEAILAAGDVYDPELRHDVVARHLGDERVRRRYESAFQIRVNQYRARLATGVVWAVAAVALALGLVATEPPGGADLGELITVAVVAQFTFSALASAAQQAALVARHHSDYESYARIFRTGGGRDPGGGAVRSGEVWVVRDKAPPDPTGLRRWLEDVGVVTGAPVALVAEVADLPDVALAQLLTGRQRPTPERVQAALAVLYDLSGHPPALGDLDRSVTEVLVGQMPSTRLAISLTPLVLHPRPLVVVLSLRAFCELDRHHRKAALQLLDAHHVLLVGRRREHLLDHVDRFVEPPGGAVGARGDGGPHDDEEDDEP